MLEAIGAAVPEVIGWIGDVLTAMTGTDGVLKDLLPIFAIGVAVTGVVFGVKILKSFTWGR